MEPDEIIDDAVRQGEVAREQAHTQHLLRSFSRRCGCSHRCHHRARLVGIARLDRVDVRTVSRKLLELIIVTVTSRVGPVLNLSSRPGSLICESRSPSRICLCSTSPSSGSVKSLPLPPRASLASVDGGCAIVSAAREEIPIGRRRNQNRTSQPCATSKSQASLHTQR